MVQRRTFRERIIYGEREELGSSTVSTFPGKTFLCEKTVIGNEEDG